MGKMVAVRVTERDGTLTFGEEQPLFEQIVPHGFYSAFPYDVTPDGKRFLTLIDPPDAKPRMIHVITNVIEEMKRLKASGKQP